MDSAPPKPETSESRPADLQTLMCVMDLAEQSRSKLEEYRLDDPDQAALNKEALAGQLRAHYQKQGVTMPEEAIAEAVDEFVAGQSRFQNTLTGLPLILARLYIRRVPILSAAAAFMLVAGLAAFAGARHNRTLRRDLASSVRQRIAETSRRLSALQQTAATGHDEQKRIEAQGAQSISSGGETAALQAALRQWEQTEKEEYGTLQNQSGALVRRVGEIKARMEKTDAPPVSASKKEEELLATIDQAIDPLERKVQTGHGRLQDENLALRDWTEELDQSRRAARLEKMGPVERQAFLSALQSARDSLEAARYEEASLKLEENRKRLAAADEADRREAENRARITEAGLSIKALLEKIRAEAAGSGKEDVESRVKGEELDLAAGDLNGLTAKLNSLRQIDAMLNASFHLRITTGPKTGVQRTLQGSRANQWYIIVEATDDNNNRVPFPVASVETGKTESVSTWGEAVPDNLFQELRNEKKLHGVINNREFGVKRRGSLKIDYTRIDHPVAEITSW